MTLCFLTETHVTRHDMRRNGSGSDKERPAAERPTNALYTNARGVALLLGHKAGWFYAHRKQLECEGMPRKDRLMNGWYVPAVQAWLDRRHGLGQHGRSPDEAELDRALFGHD